MTQIYNKTKSNAHKTCYNEGPQQVFRDLGFGFRDGTKQDAGNVNLQKRDLGNFEKVLPERCHRYGGNELKK